MIFAPGMFPLRNCASLAPQVNHRFFISGQADTGSKLVALFEDRLQSLSNPLEIISTESVRNHGVFLFEEIGFLKTQKWAERMRFECSTPRVSLSLPSYTQGEQGSSSLV
jgi:hypothetical protein